MMPPDSKKIFTSAINIESLKKSVDACEQFLDENPDDLKTSILLSKIYWSIGNLQDGKSQQREWFVRGRDVAKRIREIYPDRPNGYYWFGVNYGEWVDRSSIFAKIGAKKIILENMEKVLALDEKYDSGGAWIIIGRINYIAPGGSYTKAIQSYERAIELGPRRTTPYLYLGELFLHEHLFKKAEEMLQKTLNVEIDPRYTIESKNDRKTAERLLKKLGKKEEHFPKQEELTGH